MITSQALLDAKARLLASPLLFIQFFYKERTGRDFILSEPISRESHHITICKAFHDILNLKTNRLLINIAPGLGKSELCKGFVAWAIANYPDSKFIYVSYSQELAAGHTADIKQIISLPIYKKLFGVEIDNNYKARDNFKTNFGGQVVAAGSGGTITGLDAGLPVDDRFTGGLIIDDAHKPGEVFSDTIRESVINNFKGTLMYRLRSPNAFMMHIGQRLHEEDLAGWLIKGGDNSKWSNVILPTIDNYGNILDERIYPRERLEALRITSPYDFAAQHLQDPISAGSTVFKQEYFYLLEKQPEIICTFITADTAETDKTWNDATVFSFWGVYEVKHGSEKTGLYGLYWLDCRELRIEPKDLENEFMQFYYECMRHPVKPKKAIIEEKSTGVTLVSTLKSLQGVQIIPVKPSQNKMARFNDIQPYIASHRVTLPENAKHTKMCIDHCIKITLNNAHTHDDIADTLYYAVKAALIDGQLDNEVKAIQNYASNDLYNKLNAIQTSINNAYENRGW